MTKRTAANHGRVLARVARIRRPSVLLSKSAIRGMPVVAKGEKKDMAHSPESFERLIDVSDIFRAQTRLRTRLRIMYGIAAALVAVAFACTAIPMLMQRASQSSMSELVSSGEERVRLWPKSRIDDALKSARAYNRKLAASGQPVLGEAIDPFTRGGRSFSHASKDRQYNRLLNEGHGVIGSVVIPKISVDLPIYHGTGDKQLSLGAGHLYGTSLPVGGKSTHAVITGHRGLVKAQMFTRLDEMRKGDFIYIKTMNRILAYEVDRIAVIEPNDTSLLRILPGQDRLTLMTCTPYGINSHRLLVSGRRVGIPVPAPDPTDLHDGRTVGGWSALSVTLCGCAGVVAYRKPWRSPGECMRHATRMYGKGAASRRKHAA